MESGQTTTPALGFLSLPPEVREEIYKQLFDDDGIITLERDAKSKKVTQRGWRIPHNTFALLRTCKLVRAEARPIALSQHLVKFCEESPSNFQAFFQFLGPVAASHITRLRIDMPNIVKLGWSLDKQDRPYARRPRSHGRQLRSASRPVGNADERGSSSSSSSTNTTTTATTATTSIRTCKSGQDGLYALSLIHKHCPRLRRLTMGVREHDHWHIHECNQSAGEERSRAAFQRIDQLLRSWPLLESITVYFGTVWAQPTEKEFALLEDELGWGVGYSTYAPGGKVCCRRCPTACGFMFSPPRKVLRRRPAISG